MKRCAAAPCPGPGHARTLAWLHLLLALLPACSAQLRITAGPTELVGLDIAAPPFGFSRARFAVADAKLVLTEAADWSYAGGRCPPAYVGARELRGAILVHAHPAWLTCSFEEHARGAADRHGVVAWAHWADSAALLGTVAGAHALVWKRGDARHLAAPPAVDTASPQLAPIVRALRAGAALRASLAPSTSEWASMRESAWFTLWQAVCGMLALATAEFAAAHLFAFIRADGGPRASIAHAMLVLEVGVNALRATSCVDAYGQRAWLSVHAGYAFSLGALTAATVASALFLAHFAQAASRSGVASFRLTVAWVRRVLLGIGASMLALYAAFALAFALVPSPASVRTRLVAEPCVHTILPLLLAALGAHTAQRVRRRLRGLPPPVLRALLRRVRLSVWLSLARGALGPFVAWGLQGPWRMLCVLGTHHMLAYATTCAQVGAFAPVGTRVVYGPLCAVTSALICGARALLGSLAPRAPAPAHEKQNERKLSPRAISGGVCSGRGGFAVSTVRATRLSSAGSIATPERLAPAPAPAPAPARSRSPDGSPMLAKAASDGLRGASSGAHRDPSAMAARPASAARGARGDGTRCGSGDGAAAAAADDDVDVDDSRLLLGVSPAFLRAFAGEHGLTTGQTTYEVAAIVRDLTRKDGRSLAELALAAATEAGGRPAVRRATLFVTHAQACSFLKLVDAVEAHLALHVLDPRETYLWIDVFAIRQHRVADDVTRIASIERAIGRIVVVLDPWNQPKCLTRMWCLYEIAQCKLADDEASRRAGRTPSGSPAGARASRPSGGKVSLSLTMADSERKALVRALEEQSDALLAVQHMFDVRTAQSSVDLDRVRILQHIHATFRRGTPSLSRMPPMPVRASRQGGAQGAGADGGCAGGAALSVSLTARCCRALALPIVSVARVAPRIARCSDVASAGGQAASPADAAPASASWTAELSKARAECAAVATLIAPARARASDEEASFDRFNASVREELGRALALMSWQLSRPVSSTGGLAAQRSRRQHNVSMSSTRISSSAVGGSTTHLSSAAVGTCVTPTASTSPSIPSSPTTWASVLPSRLLTPLGRSRLGGGSPALVDRRCPPDEHVATITPLSRGRADRKRRAVSTTR